MEKYTIDGKQIEIRSINLMDETFINSLPKDILVKIVQNVAVPNKAGMLLWRYIGHEQWNLEDVFDLLDRIDWEQEG